MNDSSINDNSANVGGGISFGGSNPVNATITVSNSTISNNSATSLGGGIYDGNPGYGDYDTTGAIIPFGGGTPPTATLSVSNSIISG
ncbi:MAG: hypothetical protein ACYT04_96395, partial [Nostoc sp.]